MPTTARKSVVWAMGLIGSFYLLTSVLGLGAASILGPDYILTHGGTNMSGPLLAQALAGQHHAGACNRRRVCHDSGCGGGSDHQRVHILCP